jgi:hypothetical protein
MQKKRCKNSLYIYIYIYLIIFYYFFKIYTIYFNIPLFHTIHKQGMCHTVALPFTLKFYLKAKEELWKLKYIHHPKNKIK